MANYGPFRVGHNWQVDFRPDRVRDLYSFQHDTIRCSLILQFAVRVSSSSNRYRPTMRLSCILIAAAITLIASVEAVSSATTSSSVVHSDDMPINSNRFLRVRETVDEDSDGPEEDDSTDSLDEDDSTDEERGLTNGVSEKIAGAVTKVAKLKSVARLEAENKVMAKAAHEVLENYIPYFKTIKEMGWDSKTLRKTLNIDEKASKMTPARMEKDHQYLLWKHYTEWLDGSYMKNLEF